MPNMNQTNEEDSKKKGIVIDPSNLANAPSGVKVKLDLEEDAWAASVLPPHDRYNLRPTLAKNGLIWNPVSEKHAVAHYAVNLEMRIVSDDLDVHNYPVFMTVTTKLGRGRKISTCAGMIKKLGFKPPEEMDDKMQAMMLIDALKKEKMVVGEVDWRASYQEVDGKWKNVCSTMYDFPKEEDGTYRSQFRIHNSKGTPEEIKAQLQVKHVWSKKEFKDAQDKGELKAIDGKVVGAGSKPAVVQVVEEDEEPQVQAIKKPKEEPVKAETKKPKAKPEPELEEVDDSAMALALVEDE